MKYKEIGHSPSSIGRLCLIFCETVIYNLSDCFITEHTPVKKRIFLFKGISLLKSELLTVDIVELVLERFYKFLSLKNQIKKRSENKHIRDELRTMVIIFDNEW